MPHDANGNPVKVGDIATMCFRVTAVQVGDEYCNVSLESLLPMFPGDYKTALSANAKQINVVVTSPEQTTEQVQ